MVNLGGFGGHKGNDASAKRGVAKLAGGLPVLLFALTAWVVALAGVAVLRHAGGEGVLGQELSFTWWVIFFSLFVLLAALIHLFGAGFGFLPIGAAAISGILAVATALTMLETQRWNSARSSTTRGNELGNGVRTAFAGFLALSALNALLILIVGNAQDSHRYPQQNQTQHKSSSNPDHTSTATRAVPESTGMAYATTYNDPAPDRSNAV